MFDSLLLIESTWGAKYEVEDELEEARREWGSLSTHVVLICVRALGFDSLKARTLSSANTSSLSTHMLSESGYPFHLTKYCVMDA